MARLATQDTDSAQLDLTPLFLPGRLKQATRTARVEGQSVTLSDEISGATPGSTIRWAMTTEAAITLNGNEATLKQGGKTLHVRFTGTPVSLEVVDISKPRADYDSPNPNTRQLIARAPAGADGRWRVTVRFSGA